MTWYVHRRGDGSIASAHAEPQPGYAEEEVEDTDADLQAILNPPKSYRDLIAEENRKRLGKQADNTREETRDDVVDAILETLAQNPSLTLPQRMTDILAERAAIRAEIPEPAGFSSNGRN